MYTRMHRLNTSKEMPKTPASQLPYSVDKLVIKYCRLTTLVAVTIKNKDTQIERRDKNTVTSLSKNFINKLLSKGN